MLGTPSFRTRILVIVLVVAVVPLGLLGLWLTRATVRSGEELLRTRLDDALETTVARIGARWVRHRSDLLYLAEDESARRALLDGGASTTPTSLQARFDELSPQPRRVAVRDVDGREIWSLEPTGARPAIDEAGGGTIRVALDVPDFRPGRLLGTVAVSLDVRTLVGDPGAIPTAAGMVLAAFDVTSGESLLPLPFDATLLEGDRFVWGGDTWLTARRTLADPPLELAAAAPLGPFTQPFEGAARRGTWLLVAVAVVGFALTVLLTTRMTRTLQRLAAAAEAVSQGELDRKVELTGDDEVGRLARAFNTMTESLRRTLRELADRQALAAVGEFASSLAHEVRNPLTSIRVDLQRVEEELPQDSPLREPQSRALEEIARLDSTVKDALTVARTGRIEARPIELSRPLEAAIHAAQPAFAERGATLESGPLDAVTVQGDAPSLQRLFLNLLLNAAQALNAGGRATVAIETVGGEATVIINDTGSGIPDEQLPRIFEPFYSTRPGGTGLGLAIARRIITAHGGEIEIDSGPEGGTAVRVRIPLA